MKNRYENDEQQLLQAVEQRIDALQELGLHPSPSLMRAIVDQEAEVVVRHMRKRWQEKERRMICRSAFGFCLAFSTVTVLLIVRGLNLVPWVAGGAALLFLAVGCRHWRRASHGTV